VVGLVTLVSDVVDNLHLLLLCTHHTVSNCAPAAGLPWEYKTVYVNVIKYALIRLSSLTIIPDSWIVCQEENLANSVLKRFGEGKFGKWHCELIIIIIT